MAAFDVGHQNITLSDTIFTMVKSIREERIETSGAWLKSKLRNTKGKLGLTALVTNQQRVLALCN